MVKTYTDAEQSLVLKEILPIDTADFSWAKNFDSTIDYRFIVIPYFLYSGIGLPCWGLGSLIELLPSTITLNGDECELSFTKHTISYYNKNIVVLSSIGDNMLDACVKMFVTLSKLDIKIEKK